jgi:hypothetical protein
MGYSIELYFDPRFEEKIRRLWNDLAESGVPSILHQIGSRPHLSLAVLENIPEVQVSNLLARENTFPLNPPHNQRDNIINLRLIQRPALFDSMPLFNAFPATNCGCMLGNRVLYMGGCVGVLAGGCKVYLNQRKGASQGLPGKSQKSTSPILNTICQNYSILIHLD